ncbi:hypothetical protein FRC06_005978 [Ceratobasidium sp. 370]|nr:hypothetical protein FRC06_005978 [Ceratobasidium sp. 370]
MLSLSGYPEPDRSALERKLAPYGPTRIEPMPTEWPEEIAQPVFDLHTRMRKSLRYEDTWDPSINSILGHYFPTPVQGFTIGHQYPLRKPLFANQVSGEPESGDSNSPMVLDWTPNSPGGSPTQNSDDEDMPSTQTSAGSDPDWTPTPFDSQPSNLDDGETQLLATSISSFGHAVQGRGQGHEPDLCKPDVVIRYGFGPEALKIVAVIEYKVAQTINSEDAGRFDKYAKRLLELGECASRAHLILITGGIAFYWRPDEIQALISQGWVTESYLEARQAQGLSVRVDGVGFMQLFVRVRNWFADSLSEL